MAKTKQFTKPPKKQKGKAVLPETADEYQEAADNQEETGGKWRAGDPAKSGRAFVRALEIYDKGLQRYPNSFDLAYNKARLELEITQQPALVSHIGLPLADLLKQTLNSHRYVLRLNEENPDALFNTSQVLTSLAEQLSEGHESSTAIPLLQEALELLSSCLSRQEMLLEQQQADLEDADEGGVALDVEERPASTTGSETSGQTFTIETPITASDLLDTVHASLSALTTLVSLVEAGTLETLGDMAHSLTEKRAPAYVGLLSADAQEAARFTVALDRASFVGAFADAQYNAYMIEAETYLARLEAFSIPGKEQNATALGSEAEARTELATSVIARFEGSSDLPLDLCWKQLSLAQDLYTKATKLGSSAQVYLSRGDVEMLRHRLASSPYTKVTDGLRKSAPTLALNAYTYYKGAVRLATDEDAGLKSKAQQRIAIASDVRVFLYGIEASADVDCLQSDKATGLVDCVEEGLLETALAEELAKSLPVK
ncbi:hypothetical protein LTR36_001410 [Oleoguttula mirabilis]|uniref:Uncharacterized protein n=1 Tax=Oleoguttula mirabilis TaxID=1507867 RepID=A0AAV9JPA9_9PEZI|nr:hypothetical protein LTR36_001410 [Oleoguttula mirabilis]